MLCPSSRMFPAQNCVQRNCAHGFVFVAGFSTCCCVSGCAQLVEDSWQGGCCLCCVCVSDKTRPLHLGVCLSDETCPLHVGVAAHISVCVSIELALVRQRAGACCKCYNSNQAGNQRQTVCLENAHTQGAAESSRPRGLNGTAQQQRIN